jgi:triphosphoribosyl-dephospho-CoA synthetase
MAGARLRRRGRCSAATPTGETLGVFSAILSTAAAMGVSQAVNRERQRGELATHLALGPADRRAQPAAASPSASRRSSPTTSATTAARSG